MMVRDTTKYAKTTNEAIVDSSVRQDMPPVDNSIRQDMPFITRCG